MDMLDKRPLPQIIDLIESKELLPGERLPSEQELMKELSVGRGTIREAIKSLVSRNIVEIRRGVGTFVAEKTGVVEDPLGFSFINNRTNSYMGTEISSTFVMEFPNSKTRWRNLL